MRHFTYAISIVTCVSAVASAQTTVAVSGSPAVQDTTIRGGAFAATNFDGGLLATKLSSNATYIRHALVDFDTGTTIPAKSGIQSATLTLTVHSGGPQPLRTIGVYPVTRGFTDREATWDTATVTTPWTTAGGDLGPRAAAAAVPNTPGQHATFDVTSLVQAVVASTGSRHTRLALVDVDSLTSAAEGYRDYYSTEALDATQRPTLTIVYGRPATMVPNFSHVFVIVMENREYTDVIENPAAPYINRLANHYALATNYTAVAHPSLPDYMALTSGDTFFTTDCSGCIVDIKNVPDAVGDSGRTWKAYFESMPAACTTTDSGLYAQKHNPFVHYQDIVGNATRCRKHVLPLTAFSTGLASNTLPSYVWITPNLCHDMHDCSVAAGDAWLSSFMPKIINSPAFANSVVFLVWDEGTTTTGGGGHIPLVVISPLTPAGFRSSVPYDHYSLLRTIEAAWHMPALGKSSTATTLGEFFR